MGKNGAFPAMRPFLLASKTFPRNSQAEFPLGPVGQGWVPDAGHSQDHGAGEGLGTWAIGFGSQWFATEWEQKAGTLLGVF